MTAARRRLLVLASTYPRWAGDHEPGFVHELAKRLAGRFEVTVLCPHAAGALRRERLDGVDVVRYRYAPDRLEKLVNDGGITSNLARQRWMVLLVPCFVAMQLWALWRLLRRLRPDVVHAHWIFPQGLLVAGLGVVGIRTPPLVVTSHGADLFAFRSAPMRALKRFVLRRSDAVTVVSEGMRNAVHDLAGDAMRGLPVHVQPMGVDLAERFRAGGAKQRSPAGFLFVGRLVEKKGLAVLLEAFAIVRAAVPAATLAVAGFGPELGDRQEQARRLGLESAVRFLGAVGQQDLPALYRSAAVFVAPFVEAAGGDQDGLGLVMIEALGCGCPVVASDLPATRGLAARCDGIRLVPPADPGALARALLEALSTTWPARFSGIDGFDWGARADAYAALLDGAADTQLPRARPAEPPPHA